MVTTFHLFPRPPEFPGMSGGLTKVQSPSNNSFRPSWEKSLVTDMEKRSCDNSLVREMEKKIM